MKSLLIAVVVIGAVSFLNNPVLAGDGESYVAVMGSYLEPDGALNTDDGQGFHIGVGKELGTAFNIEGFLRSAHTDGSPKFKTVGAGADLQLVLGRDNRFRPYVFGGLAHERADFTGKQDESDLSWARGVGFRADLSRDKNVSLRAEYRFSGSNNFIDSNDNKFYSLGVQFNFGGAPEPVVVAAAPTLDSDGDGVNDDLDRCPNTPAGVTVDAAGCAVDSDGDGVADYIDECPGTVAGAAVDEKGCEMDGDGDGVVDRLDECPNSRPGAQVDTVGCELKEEITLPGVNFETNSDRLLAGAENSLDKVAATLKKYPEIKVEIGGHTDSDGDAAYNESLSARRAATVVDYLANKGIADSRMNAIGYGESQPVADNSTAAGKAENRRVVLKITER